MSVRLYSDSHLYRTGSLKWTGITTASGEPTIGAWVAEMDFGTAPEVADAMKGAIDDGLLGYQPTWLEPRIAGATAEFQKRRFGWDVDASQVRLVASVLPALEATINHLVRPGAPIIVPTPAYMPFLTIPGKFMRLFRWSQPCPHLWHEPVRSLSFTKTVFSEIRGHGGSVTQRVSLRIRVSFYSIFNLHEACLNLGPL